MKNVTDRFLSLLVVAGVLAAGTTCYAQVSNSLAYQTGANNSAPGRSAAVELGQARVNPPIAAAPPAARAPQPSLGVGNVRILQYTPPRITYFPPVATTYPYPWNSPYPSPIPNPYTPQNSYYSAPSYPAGYYPSQSYVDSYYSSGFDFGGYVPTDDGNNAWPTVYALYSGMPMYFDSDDASVSVSGPSNMVYDNGTWYQYGYDPFNQGTVGDSGDAFTPAAGDNGASASALPQDLRRSLSDIAQAWKSRDVTPMEKHMSASGQVQVSFGGQYSYSIGAKDYALMTRDAMQRLGTTDFRFTGVKMQSNGDSVGYAVQTYRAPTGDISKMYLAYTLRKDSTQPSGYSLAGVGTSKP